MADKKDYLKGLKRMYAASDATLLTKIDELDLAELEDLAESEFTVKVIDPPIVNGVDLREHPVPAQRKYYNKMLRNGGTIKGVYDNEGTLLHLASIGRSTSADVRKSLKLRRVTKKIADAIDDDFEPTGERGKHGRARPKQMTPDDFWGQFQEKVLDTILGLEDPEAIAFVDYVNAQAVVDLKDKTIKKGLQWLKKKKIIHKRSFGEDIGED